MWEEIYFLINFLFQSDVSSDTTFAAFASCLYSVNEGSLLLELFFFLSVWWWCGDYKSN